MNIFLNNTANYPVKVMINSAEYFLKPKQTWKIDLEEENIIISTYILDEQNNSGFVSSKIKNALKKLCLDISCTFVVNNISDGDTLYFHNRIYEFKDNSLFLPFAYHFLTIDNETKKFVLLDCNVINLKSIKKLYFMLSIFGDGGFDFLINMFSILFQMKRINKLCEHQKVFEIISKNLQK